MKRGLIFLASITMLMLAGCGEGGATSSSAAGGSSSTGGALTNSNVVITDKVGTDEVAVTTPKNLYNISSTMGTPPALPGE